MRTQPPPAPPPPQLGQTVRFSRVIASRRSADGLPIVQSLGAERTGIVIGMRRLYERVPDTHPPRNINPVCIYLVAVTLHRHYKVYAADIRL